MRTGRDVAIAALLGAEEYGFCTAALIISGCVMLRHCHLNNCSVGVATQDEILERKFQGRPEYVINFFHFIARELREIMASLGIRTIDEMIGRTDLLEVNTDILPPKAGKIDFSRILFKPDVPKSVSTHCTIKQDHGIDKILDLKLNDIFENSIKKNAQARTEMEIKNINRTTGANLSGKLCASHGEKGLPEDTLYCKFKGTAGQSFGAWLASGITFELEGMANDYVGKGISGGKIIIYPDRRTDYVPEENIIIGNTAFYGAITGEAYIRGVAGERFCIRNSGLLTVVEGVGDHGCEYMTGGKVVVLGRTGRNFGAGMSGGVAYVYDTDGDFKDRCNMEMVTLEKLDKQDEIALKELLANHHKYSNSAVAKGILENFKLKSRNFVKVMPMEYKRILDASKAEAKKDLSEASDG
jgi:glutamate synthase domain-containing protein 3